MVILGWLHLPFHVPTPDATIPARGALQHKTTMTPLPARPR